MAAGSGTAASGGKATKALTFPFENVERRILGHLPAYRTQKEQKDVERLERDGHTDTEVKALLKKVENEDDDREGTDEDPRVTFGCGFHISGYTVAELTQRLKRDEFFSLDVASRATRKGRAAPAQVDESFVSAELDALEARGLAKKTGDNWKMTKAGLEALTAEQED